MLGALLFLVVPKSKVPGFKRSLTPDTFSQAAVEMDNIPEGVGSEVFCIVFDAGSTGESCSPLPQQAPTAPQAIERYGTPGLRPCEADMSATLILRSHAH